MKEHYIKEDIIAREIPGKIVQNFLASWILMLVVGGLGHQLHLSHLFIGYWSAFLIVWAAHLLQRSQVTRWKVSNSREFSK